jgi:hypothetical protein
MSVLILSTSLHNKSVVGTTAIICMENINEIITLVLPWNMTHISDKNKLVACSLKFKWEMLNRESETS